MEDGGLEEAGGGPTELTELLLLLLLVPDPVAGDDLLTSAVVAIGWLVPLVCGPSVVPVMLPKAAPCRTTERW